MLQSDRNQQIVSDVGRLLEEIAAVFSGCCSVPLLGQGTSGVGVADEFRVLHPDASINFHIASLRVGAVRCL